MSQYNTGTVAVTNGSATVTGTGTAFTANVTAGDFFTVVGDNAFYTVGSVDSNTQLTLAANYAGLTASGKAYTLARDFTTNLGFPVPNQGDIETALVVKRAIEEIDAELNTAGIGGDGREWIDLKDTPTYVSATQFTVATDKTANYHVDRRIRATDSSTVYGRIIAASFAASVTTVTVVWDAGNLTAALTGVALGIGTANGQFPISGSAVKGGTPRIDVIAEYTAAAGVIVDGVLHKDGLVSTATPTSGTHAANKNYVDALVVSGVYWKQPVRLASTSNLTLSGEQTIDGVATSADRILVKDQSTGSENGIYVTASGGWSRSTDADADAEVIAGIAVYVAEGSANGDKAYTLTTDDPITVGTTSLTFAQFGVGAGVTSVTGSAPVTSSGGSTPDIAISAATTGTAGSMSASDKTKLDGVAASANNYSHPNHTGDVTSSGDGAQTIAANAVTLAKLADMATASLLGRNTASTGDPEVLSKATALSLLNVADGAEVNPAVISQADAEAGTATDERIFTAQRVKQAIDALAGTTDNVARDNIMLNFFLDAVANGWTYQLMEDGLVDEFEDELGVDTAASTNEIYDSTDDFYSGFSSAIEGNFAAAHATAPSWGDGYATRKHLGWKFTNTNVGTITQVKFEVKAVVTAFNCHAELFTNNAGSPGSQVGTDSDTVNLNTTGDKTFTFATPPSVSAATDYWIVFVDESTSGKIDCSVEATEPHDNGFGDTITAIAKDTVQDIMSHRVEVTVSSADNMTLQSNAFTAGATPTDARIVLFEEDVDAVTPNTDLKAWASRDGGTTWTQITLADEGDYATGKQILAGSADISGQPSGTSMKWKVTTLNTKELKLHGVALQWS